MSTIAPIKGMLRKRLFTDVTIALGGGTLVAMGFWYGWHLPRNQIRDEFYAKLHAAKKDE
ncbi:hypothetical protein MGL_0998 [Malassezia globosa CBS 7966]|uniref:Cytochrome c oxidase subunit 9, mitochondrial n=1 Tax=Malassezia globosa (strain ATCC MYA-4612 / CBS 7966) TaxID=425265 RepID=A8PW05_MALGO|nr:uncharacterized protein MGL_0998 [Malassezia globosa CBS 7966]EDP44516.1 hypothetical protein MGL_0998 [Malassezia globosa CBS 7966]